ncbi:6-bladed beta-propeller [Capnocytophaga canis]|uniref:6-bladed beta-propeller n=1 Tax=Capnocytophaga canis TaxID=1848903 RepID=UPI001562CE9B|nr:6-bladed beta-propeller [Capnocytophaga canis]
MGTRFLINLCYFFLVIFVSCESHTEKQVEYEAVLDLKESMGVEKLSIKPLEATQMIPLEFTKRSVLRSAYIEGVTDEYIVVRNGNSLIFFDTQGKFLSKISRMGNGPEEYIENTYSWIDFDKKEAHVYDLHRKSVKRYDFSGNFIEEKKNVHLWSFTELSSDRFIAYNDMLSNFEFTIYDKNWNVKDSIIERKDKFNIKDFNVIKSFQISKNNIFFYNAPIIYQSKNGGMFPKIFLEKGNLQIPDEIHYDLSRKNEKQRYIWNDFVTLAGDYLFLSYYYDNKKYDDIWNVKNQKLLYRNTISSPDELPGVPISVNGEEVRGWIRYFENDMFYFVVSEGEQEKLNVDNEENPIIVVTDLKTFEKSFSK